MRFFRDRADMDNSAGKWRTAAVAATLLAGLVMLLWIATAASSANMIFDNEEVYLLDTGWTAAYEGKKEEVALPVHLDSKAGEKVVFTRVLRKEDGDGNSVMFHSSHQYVKICIDDKELISYGEGQKKPFKMSVGSPWIHVRLPADWEGNTLRIETISVYDDYAGMQEEIYLGTKNALVSMIYRKALLTMLWNLPIIIIGICLFLASFMFKERRTVSRIRYLGMTAIVTSLWICLESKVAQVFTGNILVSMNLIFILFGLIPVLFSRFLLTYESFENSRYMKAAFWYSIANYGLIQALQIFGIRDYMETVPAVHVAIIIIILGIVFRVAGKYIKKEKFADRSLYGACLIFAGFALLDILRFYISTPLVDVIFFSRIGLMCFLIILGYHALKEAVAEKEGQIEKETWKRLAVTDTLTGLPNRMSFEERMKFYREEKQSGKPIVMVVDLNNLKWINDKFGHSTGDVAIIRTGDFLRQTFQNEAECFRIGGDEFCVIAEDMTVEEFEYRMELFTALLRQENQNTEYKLSAAYGFVKADSGGIDETFRQADQRMYECKLRMKATKDNGKDKTYNGEKSEECRRKSSDID